MNDNMKMVDLKQGEGAEQIVINMIISQAVLDKMNELRSHNPKTWRNRDLDLLEEAERLLSDGNDNTSAKTDNATDTSFLGKTNNNAQQKDEHFNKTILLIIAIGVWCIFLLNLGVIPHLNLYNVLPVKVVNTIDTYSTGGSLDVDDVYRVHEVEGTVEVDGTVSVW